MYKNTIYIALLFSYFKPMSQPYRDIFDAIKNGDLAAVKTFAVNKTCLYEKNFSGNTPLIYALVFRKEQIADYLIDAGSDLSVIGGDKVTPLFMSMVCGFYDTTIRLLQKGADPYFIRGFDRNTFHEFVQTLHPSPKLAVALFGRADDPHKLFLLQGLTHRGRVGEIRGIAEYLGEKILPYKNILVEEAAGSGHPAMVDYIDYLFVDLACKAIMRGEVPSVRLPRMKRS